MASLSFAPSIPLIPMADRVNPNSSIPRVAALLSRALSLSLSLSLSLPPLIPSFRTSALYVLRYTSRTATWNSPDSAALSRATDRARADLAPPRAAISGSIRHSSYDERSELSKFELGEMPRSRGSSEIPRRSLFDRVAAVSHRASRRGLSRSSSPLRRAMRLRWRPNKAQRGTTKPNSKPNECASAFHRAAPFPRGLIAFLVRRIGEQD